MFSILGISAFYHDSAAALVIDGKIISAAQEERFTRIKHDASFPNKAIRFILKENNLMLEDINFIVFYDKPFLKFERLLETYVFNAPRGFKSFKTSMPIWLREKLFLKLQLKKEIKQISKKFDGNNILFSEHHVSHAASAFYPSPFKEALILTIDGVGEWATTTVSIGKNNDIKILKEIHFPHSLGLLYSAFTYYLGFKVNSGEYKVMGLAPYGEPKYKDTIINKLIDLKSDGSFRINEKYFNYSTGLTMVNKKFTELFGKKIRNPKTEDLEEFHMNIAASLQEALEFIVLRMIKSLSNQYKITNLCLAGGVALNCVLNSKILKSNNFKNLWIQPAAGDAGGALGSALAVWHIELKNPRSNIIKDSMNGSFLGPNFSQEDIITELDECSAKYEIYNQEKLLELTAIKLSEEKVIGWHQGRMEFGPRALGSRSILADPRSKDMQKKLNLKIKFRESFRPFAPAILREDLQKWFDLDIDSPYMLLIADIINEKKFQMSSEEENLFGIDKLNIQRSVVPAITHIDYSARIQTVHESTNPIFYKLIKQFKQITDCPILINTSFNVRGEPIVNTPSDAFKCFMGTQMDYLVIGNCFLSKENQDDNLKLDYKNKYELD